MNKFIIDKIEEIRLSAIICPACGYETTPENFTYICPDCGKELTMMIFGSDGMILKRS